MAKTKNIFRRILARDFRRASPEEKRTATREVIDIASVISATISLQPVPGVDLALISPVQILMVQAIARIHGYGLDRRSILEIAGSLGAGFLQQNAVRTAVKMIPVVGWLAGLSTAFALTSALGEAADLYFKSGRAVSSAELRQTFERVYAQKRGEKAAETTPAPSLKQRLLELRTELEAGKITPKEHEERKEKILREFS